MAQSHREASRRLFEIAEQQQGFFTTKQAKAAGFAENTHPYHVQVGNWIREHRGIYRLALFPTTDRPELVLWALWSRNRNEEVEGVYSHHTALSLYDLSDLNPSKLHMTVPTDFRRNSDIPGILVLHYADLPESDVQTAQGFKFTRPLRAILDLIEAGTVERNFIRQALRQAVDRGLITRQQIRNARMSGPARKIVEEVAAASCIMPSPRTYATAGAFRRALGRTPEEGISDRSDRPQPPPPTGIIRPPAGKAVPGRTSALGFEGRLCAGVTLQGGSINGGHRPDGAASRSIRRWRPEPDRSGDAAERGRHLSR